VNYEQLDLFDLTEAGTRTAKQAEAAEGESVEAWLDHAEVVYEGRRRYPANSAFGEWWAGLDVSYGSNWRAVLVKVGERITSDGRPSYSKSKTAGRFDMKDWANGGTGFDTNNSGQEAWYTPEWVFDGLGMTFDLDVAAPPGGVPWVPARRHFTEADDGLAQPWEGVVWCNPPYSAPSEWCRRFAEHPDMAILIRADLSTGGPLTALRAADALWAADGRLNFVDGVGQRGGAVTFSTVMLGRGPVVTAAMHRLAAERGGTTRTLT
jgi:hypothetical protein